VIEEAGRAGYSFAFMVTDRLASQDNHAFTLDRVHVQGDITLADFRSRISGLHGVLKRSLYTVARSKRAAEAARSARALPTKPGLRDEVERNCSTHVV
jgi:hypothetical protein